MQKTTTQYLFNFVRFWGEKRIKIGHFLRLFASLLCFVFVGGCEVRHLPRVVPQHEIHVIHRVDEEIRSANGRPYVRGQLAWKILERNVVHRVD